MTLMKIADGCTEGLFPGDFIPIEMDECFEWGKIVLVLLLGPNPEIDFHSSRVGLPAGQRPLGRIANLMSLGIAGPFHDHEMRIVILVEGLLILEHRGGAPPAQIEPCFWIEGIAVP